MATMSSCSLCPASLRITCLFFSSAGTAHSHVVFAKHLLHFEAKPGLILRLALEGSALFAEPVAEGCLIILIADCGRREPALVLRSCLPFPREVT